jgi:hypothetical protein
MLREAEVEIGKGLSVREMCRKLGIHEHTYYHWRREYGGLKLDQAKRMKELELENSRLKRVVAELTLDKQILAERCGGNIKPSGSSEGGPGGSPFAGRRAGLRTAGMPRAGAGRHHTALRFRSTL